MSRRPTRPKQTLSPSLVLSPFSSSVLCESQALVQYASLFAQGAMDEFIREDILPAVATRGVWWPSDWSGNRWDPTWVIL